MLNRSPFYLTADEVKSTTRITSLSSSDNDSLINKLIVETEDLVDAYCGKQEHHPDEDDNLDRVFPRIQDEDDDGNFIIPDAVKRAALIVVEVLFLQGEPNLESFSEAKAKEEISESRYSYENMGGGANFNPSNSEKLLLPPKARALLNPFKRNTYKLG
ncbi:MAG: hypothetical protein ACOCWW_00205 [Bacteroidota bacterium]